MDCEKFCPGYCFHEGENMFVIHLDECVDSGVGERECAAV